MNEFTKIMEEDNKRFNEEQKRGKQMIKEAEEGKRDYWLIKNKHNEYHLYPAEFHTAIFICLEIVGTKEPFSEKTVEEMKKLKRLKVFKRRELEKLFDAEDKLIKANKEYLRLINKLGDSL